MSVSNGWVFKVLLGIDMFFCFVLFRDPDGNLVNFFTPVSADAIKKFDARA